MAKYLLNYHGGGMAEGEEAQAKVMAAWGAWFQNLGPALADGGNPVSQAKTIAATAQFRTEVAQTRRPATA